MESVHGRITGVASELRDEIIGLRRQIYMYPEVSGDERRTSQLVADRLRSCGIDVLTNVGGYGVVGTLHGARRGPTIAWRADMDACATQDIIDTPYKSRIDGVKHVCGHDAHTAIALGIADTLASIKDDLYGTVRFIFQPYEEGMKGAARMIEDGALEHPRPSAVYGLHVTNWGPSQTYLEAGQLTVNFGAALFGSRLVEVVVKVNRENVILSTEQDVLIHHLSRVDRFNVPSQKASQNLVDFRIVARDPLLRNNEIRLRASYRFAQTAFVDEIDGELRRIIAEYQETNGYEVSVLPLGLAPPVYNDETEAEEALRLLERFVGEDAIAIRDEFPPHGLDDFALFQNELSSGLFFFLGIANVGKGILVGMHRPDFDIDEDCLEFGVRTMSSFLYETLRQTAHRT